MGGHPFKVVPEGLALRLEAAHLLLQLDRPIRRVLNRGARDSLMRNTCRSSLCIPRFGYKAARIFARGLSEYFFELGSLF